MCTLVFNYCAITLFSFLDAEVYEVHPKTRLRLTTRSPTTKVHHPLVHTTTQVKTAEAEETDYYTYQDDYVYEPTETFCCLYETNATFKNILRSF